MKINYERLKRKIVDLLEATYFIVMLFGYWTLHITFLGWFLYLFYPRMYIIRAGDISEDLEREPTRGVDHPWWNRYDYAIADQAAAWNDPDELVMFTWRTHPIFLDNEFLYVKSKNFKARIWDHRTKIYRQVK